MARQYWQGNDPLNERIVIAPNIGPEFDEAPRQIIGIAGDILDDALDQRPVPTMYVRIAQVGDARTPRIRQSIGWMVRTRLEPLLADPGDSARASRSQRRFASRRLPLNE